MHFARTLCLAILGSGISILAAPIDSDVVDVTSAVSTAIKNAASPQAVQDICSGIPFEERRRHRECEEDKADGDVWGQCLELHRTGGHDQRCGDYKTQPGYQAGGYGGSQGGYGTNQVGGYGGNQVGGYGGNQGGYYGGNQGGYPGNQGGNRGNQGGNRGWKE
ncbi:hypothetical protein EG328_000702 [Venturia inaequalis]|uniref:Uncharacterized protein n=1 Tax=Venturia inaequalis TaxID=5025 RepID=A0A8H3VVS3_VENIN|nr:hypothetical protein EG328_000702 [Venturia inaequalis]KAE9993709.1 hypothetical protein EG327_003719 [Venturia inaequalis]RDI89350.1 hypothetical protein Vi05172_g869 [Venturia inaequalis]